MEFIGVTLEYFENVSTFFHSSQTIKVLDWNSFIKKTNKQTSNIEQVLQAVFA